MVHIYIKKEDLMYLSTANTSVVRYANDQLFKNISYSIFHFVHIMFKGSIHC